MPKTKAPAPKATPALLRRIQKAEGLRVWGARPQLVALCKELGLPTSGSADALKERLRNRRFAGWRDLDVEELSEMTVAELQACASEHGFAVEGVKEQQSGSSAQQQQEQQQKQQEKKNLPRKADIVAAVFAQLQKEKETSSGDAETAREKLTCYKCGHRNLGVEKCVGDRCVEERAKGPKHVCKKCAAPRWKCMYYGDATGGHCWPNNVASQAKKGGLLCRKCAPDVEEWDPSDEYSKTVCGRPLCNICSEAGGTGCDDHQCVCGRAEKMYRGRY
jgi:hypothetical protein